MKIVVCVKQVPDTMGGVKFKPDGTLDRQAMMSIMNPDDKSALEAALRIKDQDPENVTVTALTMGLPKADAVLREAMAMGADAGLLITDRVLGGADTWATSSTIAGALKNMEYDLVITGRQAIDGDTAQVGPQVAQKLGLNQVTYAEEILKLEDGKVTIRRMIDGGVEVVEAPLPVVITVNGSAAPCRPQNAKLVMKYKRATCPMERPVEGTEYDYLYAERPYLTLNQWSVADVDGDASQCGLSGSPTKVKAVKNIVFQAKESKTLTGSDQEINDLVQELINDNIIG